MNRTSTARTAAGPTAAHAAVRGPRRGTSSALSTLWFARQDQVVRLALGLTSPAGTGAPARIVPPPFA